MSRRTALPFVFAWIILLCATPAAAQGTAYFSALPFRETPFDRLVGIHPISYEESRTRNHFRFEYDPAGRPVSVTFMLGNAVRSLNDAASLYFYTPRMEIQYGDGEERRRFFDRRGNRVLSNGDVFEEVFRLDEQGYRRSLEFLGVDGEPAANSWGVARYDWTILDDGSVVERRFNLEGEPAPLRADFPFYELRLHYGPGGWLRLMRNFGREGVLTLNELGAAQDRLEMSAAGDFLSWTVLNVEGDIARGNSPNVARGVVERDRHGYDVLERYEDEVGAPIHSAYGWGLTRSSYDEHGNRVERRNYTLDGAALADNPRFAYAINRWTFDREGLNPVENSFFDHEGHPVALTGLGFHRVRFTHDRHGDLTAIRYEDVNGDLVARLDSGVSVIEMLRDDLGRIVEIFHRAPAGDLVDHRASGFAVERRTYSDHGVPTRVERFSADGTAVAS